MKTIVRWNPVREMMAWQNALEQAFEEASFANRPEARPWSLALDAAETETAFIIKASIPGVNPDDLEITLEDDVLTIKGESKMDETVKEADFHLRERRYGTFARSLRFPVAVNADAVEADYAHGVLTLTVPKAEAVKPKRIAIRTNDKVIEG
ncbi:MAG: Hsp20/alpha crystallin family protein [Anaerolineales bacterium]|jgi:HSP20 family protein|nr:Hsp20/alpha crystallin family protein [Anaerolineales bacterium]